MYGRPYTSIIEQNAKVFKDIFGKENVLEHHCNFDFDSKGYTGSVSEKLKRSAENWDASMIVTTNVQFFESMLDISGKERILDTKLRFLYVLYYKFGK